MQDYTLNGVPVANVLTSKIEECLRDGIEILNSNGLSDQEAITRVRERLELELFIRQHLLRNEFMP